MSIPSKIEVEGDETITLMLYYLSIVIEIFFNLLASRVQVLLIRKRMLNI